MRSPEVPQADRQMLKLATPTNKHREKDRERQKAGISRQKRKS